jgi:hypothetical protein
MSPHLTTAVALALLGSACAAGSQEIDESAVLALPDSIYVEVVNDNFYDARVHAIYQGGARYTLGTIHGNGGHSETALAWQPRMLTFEVSFIIGGGAYVSHPVDVARGDVVEVRLPQNIEASGFFRRVSRN